jgi:5'-3' exonuclease
MSARSVLLIDLSSLAHPIWHMSSKEPDPDWTSTQVVARVRGLATDQPFTAICCDSGRSFRKDIDPTYKANRSEHDATLQHQIKIAIETLRADGFPIWEVRGYEADDVIGTSVARALAHPDVFVMIATADKDLVPLINGRVTIKSLRDGNIVDAQTIREKYGVPPSMVLEWLCLVGDSADNITGARGIGPKRAAELLNKYGTLDNLYEHLTHHGTQFTPALATALREFQTRLPVVRELLTLKTDAPILFDEIWRERVPQHSDFYVDDIEEAMPTLQEPDTLADAQAVGEQTSPAPAPTIQEAYAERDRLANGKDLPKVELVPMPVDFERQLEPQNIAQAKQLAVDMFRSKMYSAYGNEAAVLSTILAGRELGLPAMASLRGFHIIEGKPTMAADMMRALVLKSGKAKYFRAKERTADRCTFETFRIGDPEPVALTYTIEQAKGAWQKDDRAWKSSGWGRHPEDMLSARASSKLARLVFPDILAGIYSPEEME